MLNFKTISTLESRCYFEKNQYGFLQKRIKNESILIPKEVSEKNLEARNILKPTNDQYGSVTNLLGIDCEMDHVKPEYQMGQGMNIPIKVTIVNEFGQIVLDTLI